MTNETGIFLTPEQRAFKKKLEAFCAERIAPRVRSVDANGFSRENWADLKAFGIPRLFHAKELGGLGADIPTMAIAMETLSKYDAGSAWTIGASSFLVANTMRRYASPKHMERWVLPMIQGDIIGSIGVAEAAATSDDVSSRTILSKTADGYVLNGEKEKVTNVPFADMCMTFPRTDPKDGPQTRIVVILDLKTPGITCSETRGMGLRGMPWGKITFDKVRVANEDVVPLTTIKNLLATIPNVDAGEWGSTFISFNSIGIAQAALEEALKFVTKRDAFGRPFAHLDAIHHRIAQMRIDIESARMLAWDTLRAKIESTGGGLGQLGLMTKTYCSEMAMRVAQSAMHLHGGTGFSTEYEIERLFRDAQGNQWAAGANDRLREVGAGALTGVQTMKYDAFDWVNRAGLRSW